MTRAKKAVAMCQRHDDGGDDGTSTPEQQCLDAGLPAEVCAALGQLPVPEAPGISPIQALCDEGLPQAICDAATLPSPDGQTSPLQPLCDAGLPSQICDATIPGGAPLPDPSTLCDLLPIPLPVCPRPATSPGLAA